jgi:ADP-heptose:LPS heptosyltransferase
MSRVIRKILVIKLGSLTAFVMALAAMERIRKAHPKARITLLTTPPFEGLARSCNYFNEVETDGNDVGLVPWLALTRRIRDAKYDRIYDLENSNRTAMLFQFLRPFPPEWSGVAAGATLRHTNKNLGRMHILERQAEQLKVAGIWPDAPLAPGTAPGPDMSWILKKSAVARPTPGGNSPRPFALLAPGGSLRQPEKRWPAERFAQLAGLLNAKGLDIIIIGGPAESAVARVIQKTVGQARDLTGRTDFAQIAVLAAKAALAVGNDTGPLHLIAAAGAPTIALYSGASDPLLTAPRGHVAVIRSPELKDLPVSTVANAVASLMG